MRRSVAPLASISSQGRKTRPGASGPSADQRALRSAATLAGKLFGQTRDRAAPRPRRCRPRSYWRRRTANRARRRSPGTRSTERRGRARLHGRNDAPVDRLAAVDAAAQQHGIEIVLLFQQGRDALRRGWAIATPPPKVPFSLATSIIQSTKARRKLPSPICRTLIGRGARSAWATSSRSVVRARRVRAGMGWLAIIACRPIWRGDRRGRGRPRRPRPRRAGARRRAGRERRNRSAAPRRGAPGSTGRRACRR